MVCVWQRASFTVNSVFTWAPCITGSEGSERAHLSPPALFTWVSSVCRWIKLNSWGLKSCTAAAWVAWCRTVYMAHERPTLGWAAGSNKNLRYPLSFLRPASFSISPPLDPALPFLPVLSLCVVFWPTLTENQRQALLCQHHRQQEKHC